MGQSASAQSTTEEDEASLLSVITDEHECQHEYRKESPAQTQIQPPSSSSSPSPPPPPLMLNLSTPSQWIVTFGTFTDVELTDLLQDSEDKDKHKHKHKHETTNDLKPLYDQIRVQAVRIRDYRSLQAVLSEDPDTTTEGGAGAPCGYASEEAVCFYNSSRNLFPRSPSSPDNDRENDPLIELCERILAASSASSSRASSRAAPLLSTLARVRQKLVPGKLKEHVFWESLWTLLYEKHHVRTTARFWKQLEQQIHRRPHTGTWQPTPNSVAFWSYPEDAKRALREEKQKRLARVREELRFVLDTDKIEDSLGEWTCCHKTRYNDGCGCETPPPA
eukprot:jgi/Psemu1/293304/fgenesh1_pg.2071_\